jgi:hypothetical protein
MTNRTRLITLLAAGVLSLQLFAQAPNPTIPQSRTPTQVYTLPTYLASPPTVIPINSGRQLFVDDYLIEQTTLARSAHRPTPYAGNPVLTTGSGRDFHDLAFPYSDGVWWDPADRLFKMWYDGAYGNNVCYAYSTDGKTWVKPSIPDAAVPGTNIVLQIGGGRDSVTIWRDASDPDPSRRYKAFAVYDIPAMQVYFSPDGIHWSGPQANNLNSLSDRTTVFYNPFRKVWVESARKSVPLPAAAGREAHDSRARFYAESSDALHWTDPSNVFWTGPDQNDPPYAGPGGAYPELYNLDAVAYESVLVGLFSWFHPGPSYKSYYGPGPNLVELGVGFSRDGFGWVRPTRGFGANAFIPASNVDGTWDCCNTQSAGGGFLVVGDQLWFYYSARSARKPSRVNGSTGLAVLRRDGFYSMDAGGGEGVLTTRPVLFSGNHLFVNVAAPGGRLQAEVLDSNGNPIPPFTRANSTVLSGDTTRAEIVWSGGQDLSAVANRPVKLRFYLTNGSLYSFWVTPSTAGASYGYVAAGGPGFTSQIDDVGGAVGGGTAPPPQPPPPSQPPPAQPPPPVQTPPPSSGGGTSAPPSGAPPPASSGMPANPAAFWSFDAAATQNNELQDSSGNGATARMFRVTGVNGHAGQAGHFDGASSYASVDNSASFQLTSDLTLSAWVRTSDSQRYRGIVSMYDPDRSEYNYLLRLTPAGTLSLLVGGANVAGGYRFDAVDQRAINDGAWHHVAAVLQLGRGVTFYVDGALSSTVPANLQPAARPIALTIGMALWKPYGANFDGDIDQVRIYRRALVAAEAQALAKE